MKKVGVVVVILALCLGVGAGWAQDVSVEVVVEQAEHALLNWTAGYVEATGQAVPPTDKANTAQGKLLARRGAIVDLQRNLLEFVQGVRVDAETVMKDFMANDFVKTEVHGCIKRVEVTGSAWDGEIYTVTGRIKLEDLRRAVTPALPTKPVDRQAPPAPKKGNVTGLVLDVRHLPLIPAMTFRVLDEGGREVYSLNFVDRERFLSSGLCDYQTNINYAQGAPRVADKPLMVKAVRVVEPRNVDIVVPNSAAGKIKGSAYDFRVTCRVTVVKR